MIIQCLSYIGFICGFCLLFPIGIILWFVFNLFPAHLITVCAHCLAYPFFILHSSRRKIAVHNAYTVLNHPKVVQKRGPISPEEIKGLVYKSYVHLGLSIIELIRDPFVSPHIILPPEHSDTFHFPPLSSWKQKVPFLKKPLVHLHGIEHLRQALNTEQGLFLVSAHLGSWEILAKASQWIKKPTWLISKRMSVLWIQSIWDLLRLKSPRRLDQGWRARFILQALKRGEVVADVLDQHDARTRSCQLSFFYQPAWTSLDIARFSRLSGVCILPIFTWREGNYHHIEIGHLCSPLESDEIQTQRLLNIIEDAILKHPEQWLWIHRRWKKKKREILH